MLSQQDAADRNRHAQPKTEASNAARRATVAGFPPAHARLGGRGRLAWTDALQEMRQPKLGESAPSDPAGLQRSVYPWQDPEFKDTGADDSGLGATGDVELNAGNGVATNLLVAGFRPGRIHW
jgi:hypothetical protein